MKPDGPNTRRVLLTGSPGAGKTTLLGELKHRGYSTVADSARSLIRRRKQACLPARPFPLQFAQQMLEADIRQYMDSRPGQSGLLFFERGIPDALGMLAEHSAFVTSDMERLLAAYPYHGQAFILPPWEEIYVTDSERDQDFNEAKRVDGLIRQWYARCGYRLVEVPTVSVAARCEFILQQLGENV